MSRMTNYKKMAQRFAKKRRSALRKVIDQQLDKTNQYSMIL
jgi:uncharacterized membrane protein (DUF106 family)